MNGLLALMVFLATSLGASSVELIVKLFNDKNINKWSREFVIKLISLVLASIVSIYGGAATLSALLKIVFKHHSLEKGGGTKAAPWAPPAMQHAPSPWASSPQSGRPKEGGSAGVPNRGAGAAPPDHAVKIVPKAEKTSPPIQYAARNKRAIITPGSGAIRSQDQASATSVVCSSTGALRSGLTIVELSQQVGEPRVASQLCKILGAQTSNIDGTKSVANFTIEILDVRLTKATESYESEIVWRASASIHLQLRRDGTPGIILDHWFDGRGTKSAAEAANGASAPVLAENAALDDAVARASPHLISP